ncbi:MAG: sodium:proton antiporter [Myxococcota bacterium]
MSLTPSSPEAVAVIVNSAAAQEVAVVSLVTLMVVATIVGILSHRFSLPYTVLLMAVGIGMSFLQLVPELHLTQDLLMTVFLPALLFEAAFHFPARELRQFGLTIGTLAIFGVVLTAVFTALVLQVEFSTFGLQHDVTFLHLLLFGTLIAATDPISVIALLRQLGVDRRISVLIEGESLFNDGTAIVLFLIVLQVATSGSFQPSDVISKLVFISLGGILIGTSMGFVARFVMGFTRDPLLIIALTTSVAYGSYLLANKLGVSGVLSTVFSGMVVGNTDYKQGLGLNARVAVMSFWEYIGFLITSVVFLLMGLELNVPLLLDHLDMILFAFAAVQASRLVAVFLPIPVLRRLGQSMAYKDATMVWWGGLRGALSMVLVLSLPEDIQVRDSLIAMTFGVVLLSIIVQGSSMGLLLKLLKLMPRASDSQTFLNTSLARLRAIDDQQRTLKRLYGCDTQAAQEIAQGLHKQRQSILDELRRRQQDPSFLHAMQEHKMHLQRYIKQAARQSYRESMNASLISEQQAAELIQELIAEQEEATCVPKEPQKASPSTTPPDETKS